MNRLREKFKQQGKSFFKRLTEFSFDAMSGISPPLTDGNREIPYMRMPSKRQDFILQNSLNPNLEEPRFGLFFCPYRKTPCKTARLLPHIGERLLKDAVKEWVVEGDSGFKVSATALD